MKSKTETNGIIVDAMRELLNKKPFQKISVNEICQTAGISRTTFYVYFEDKYQLISYILDTESGRIQQLSFNHSLEEFFEILLDEMKSRHRYFYHLLQDNTNTEIAEMIFNVFRRGMTEYIKEKSPEGWNPPDAWDLTVTFYVGGLTSMIIYWAENNFKQPKEELARCMKKILQDVFPL